MKIKIPAPGTIGRSVAFDPEAGARAEAAVAALARQISGATSTTLHSSLRNLQVGDDHPQYTMWAGPETITGLWNFSTEPDIEGESLTEFIEDVVGGDLVQDTNSITWTYGDTAGTLEANVVPEFVQDTIGGILANTASINLAYSDSTPSISATIVDEYVQDLVGAMLTDTLRINLDYNDTSGTFSADLFTDSVDNTFLANMAQSTIKGRAAGAGTGDPTDLSAAQVAAIINTTLDHNTLANLTTGDPHTQYPLAASTETISGTWTFTNTAIFTNSVPATFRTAAGPQNRWEHTSGALNQKNWIWLADNASMILYAFADDYSTSGEIMRWVRSGVTPIEVRLPNDSQELQIGASQDLRLYHNGTDSFIRNDTGVLNINEGATTVARFDTDSTAGNTRFMVYDVDNGTLERVSVGAADSGGTGFKVLRIPN